MVVQHAPLTRSPEQLRLGTAKVRDVLGNELSLTDEEIEDSLWHYYYDIEKTVNYLLSQKTFPPITQRPEIDICSGQRTTTEPKKRKKRKADLEGEKRNGKLVIPLIIVFTITTYITIPSRPSSLRLLWGVLAEKPMRISSWTLHPRPEVRGAKGPSKAIALLLY